MLRLDDIVKNKELDDTYNKLIEDKEVLECENRNIRIDFLVKEPSNIDDDYCNCQDH